MSIIIHGMEAPECCEKCLFSWDGVRITKCQLKDEWVMHGDEGRPEWCPIEEVMEDDMR